jgi:hypothetical protein
MSMTLFPRRAQQLRRLAAVLALSALPLVANAATESFFWLGLPVTFKAKEYAFKPWPAYELRQLQVQTTQPIDMKHVWLTPDWSSWMTEFKTNRMRAEVDEIVAKPAALARLGTSDGPSSRKITRVNFARLKLQVGATTLEFPAGTMNFGGDGTLTEVRIALGDKIEVSLKPTAGKLGVTVQTERLTLPALPALAFTSVVAQGEIDEQGITLDKIGANGDGGAVGGSLRVDLSEGAVLSGNLTFNSLRVKEVLDRLYPRHVVEGFLNADLTIKSSAPSIVELKAAPIQVEGTYTLKAGSIDRFGLFEGMRKSGRGVVGGGLVRFEAITGKFAGATGAIATASFGGLDNGGLKGQGSFTVKPDGQLAGSVGGTLRLPGGQTEARNLQLTGKASAPILSVR